MEHSAAHCGGGYHSRVLDLGYLVALVLTLLSVSGCSHSVPPYPPQINPAAVYPGLAAKCARQEDTVIVKPIGIRWAQGGAYADILVSSDRAGRVARLLAHAIATGETSHYIHIQCNDALLNVEPPILRDYLKPNPFFILSTPPQVTAGSMSPPNYPISESCVLQPIPIRVSHPKGIKEECHLVLMGDWRGAVAINSFRGLDREWKREHLPNEVIIHE